MTSNLETAYVGAEIYCNEHFGTSFASIHGETANDEIEIVAIAAKYGSNIWSHICLTDPDFNNENWIRHA